MGWYVPYFACLTLLSFLQITRGADHKCVCVTSGLKTIYSSPENDREAIGLIIRGECLPVAHTNDENQDWIAVDFKKNIIFHHLHLIGYVARDNDIIYRNCDGGTVLDFLTTTEAYISIGQTTVSTGQSPVMESTTTPFETRGSSVTDITTTVSPTTDGTSLMSEATQEATVTNQPVTNVSVSTNYATNKKSTKSTSTNDIPTSSTLDSNTLHNHSSTVFPTTNEQTVYSTTSKNNIVDVSVKSTPTPDVTTPDVRTSVSIQVTSSNYPTQPALTSGSTSQKYSMGDITTKIINSTQMFTQSTQPTTDYSITTVDNMASYLTRTQTSPTSSVNNTTEGSLSSSTLPFTKLSTTMSDSSTTLLMPLKTTRTQMPNNNATSGKFLTTASSTDTTGISTTPGVSTICDLFCLNGGHCVTDPVVSCQCPDGVTGTYCETCIGSMCENGDCVMIGNAPQCVCHPGYTGTFCNETHACNSSEVSIGGKCYTFNYEYESCQENYCLNRQGTECLVNSVGVYCLCRDEFDPGEITPCGCPSGQIRHLNGTCVDINCRGVTSCLHGQCYFHSFYNFGCLCDPGWEGENCDMAMTDCGKNRCYNNGSCIRDPDPMCHCTDSWTGPECDQCGNQPCHHGICLTDQYQQSNCVCDKEYTGPSCDQVEQCSGQEFGGHCYSNDLENFTPCVENICPMGELCVAALHTFKNDLYCVCKENVTLSYLTSDCGCPPRSLKNYRGECVGFLL